MDGRAAGGAPRPCRRAVPAVELGLDHGAEGVFVGEVELKLASELKYNNTERASQAERRVTADPAAGDADSTARTPSSAGPALASRRPWLLAARRARAGPSTTAPAPPYGNDGTRLARTPRHRPRRRGRGELVAWRMNGHRGKVGLSTCPTSSATPQVQRPPRRLGGTSRRDGGRGERPAQVEVAPWPSTAAVAGCCCCSRCWHGLGCSCICQGFALND